MIPRHCNKVPYNSLDEARQDMSNFKIDSDHSYVPVRAYKCEICGKCHLTSHDKKQATKKKRQYNDAKRLQRDEVSIPEILARRKALKAEEMRIEMATREHIKRKKQLKKK